MKQKAISKTYLTKSTVNCEKKRSSTSKSSALKTRIAKCYTCTLIQKKQQIICRKQITTKVEVLEASKARLSYAVIYEQYTSDIPAIYERATTILFFIVSRGQLCEVIFKWQLREAINNGIDRVKF